MTRLSLLLLFALSAASALNLMSNLKIPNIVETIRTREAHEKFGNKKLVVITGTSSGLGRKTARALLRTGKYHVVGAVRDLEKMEAVAEIEDFDLSSFTAMHVELNSYESVRSFCKELHEFKAAKPIDRLICNAAVYQPSLPYAKWSVDGHEQQMQINFLSHFLMVSLLLPDMERAPDPRVVMVGSVTGNDNTVGGGGVYPIADLKELDGLKAGAKNPISMFDGYNFDGAKAYKDSKLCLMMTSNLLHDRYHKQTGIAFSSIYPGCIAESPLFREKRPWFRKYFPIFMKYITGGFVGEEEAGMRLFQVAHDPRCSKSGVYWSWNGGPREGRGDAALEQDGQISGGGGAGGGWDSIYENDQSDKVLNKDLANDLFKHSTIVTGAEWPSAYQPKPKGPGEAALEQVVGAISDVLNAQEEMKRRKAGPGVVSSLALAADSTAPKIAQSRLLDSLPEAAMSNIVDASTDVTASTAEGGEAVNAATKDLISA
uniref:protochlorophyllide reductase n=1 Tax=Haptolina brevifila TaxID=156173 RepID=A0A7S2C0R5_9EUKA|mmetsp:Transcript_18987/g.38686  ORF Transcript_18987/g.38686 Transcript_18987/m.38686 type:complete len:487 (+) Transcript_18987:85-1545(+)|eukprot:CAMPEP_0174728800 /NCGR_PEP_ID=MMETSP1094-20130205/52447_1 /TAXON_ID=156173 /ORGANISM="Chrysochromulina brevifilum, Strain UTEX LB 985" /LENGTH=486 /DNA_ID=CAMNT_0015930795 /DNA_START=84 /DNA_END=1544 /DNA_ORIENTATION=-